MSSAIILTFHGISSPGVQGANRDSFAARYVVTRRMFEDIAAAVPAGAVSSIAALHEDQAGTSVAITFDDGLASDYEHAFPVLAGSRLVATFYVTASNIGKKGFCSAAQLRKMSEAGMEIGSHGVNHEYLTAMSVAQARTEIIDSRKYIEDIVGAEVRSFAAVGGHYRKWMLNTARSAGYTSFSSMIPGKTRKGKGIFLLKRNHIQAHQDIEYVRRLINGYPVVLGANIIKYYALLAPKALFGIGTYDRIKGLIFRNRQQ